MGVEGDWIKKKQMVSHVECFREIRKGDMSVGLGNMEDDGNLESHFSGLTGQIQIDIHGRVHGR